MPAAKTPGPVNGTPRRGDLDDGTNARIVSPRPGFPDKSRSWIVPDTWRRIGYVERAWAKASEDYAGRAIAAKVGEDAREIFRGILVGLLMALGLLIVTTGVGTLAGGAVGALAGGVGAVPGAVEGAEIGITLGNGILAWAGVGFLATYILGNFKELGTKFHAGMALAWDSEGDAGALDRAAHAFADAIGLLVSLILQAIVVYLTKSSNKQGAANALKELRASLLFKRCRGLEPWLVANFPKLRAKYVELHWTVLEEGPLIPNTSIPESLKIQVGERVFEVVRNKDKIGPEGKPIGPATKHLGERAQVTESRPEMDRATQEFKAGLDPEAARKVEGPQRWPKSEWSKAAQTDFPISSLAGALDQAEAQLMFQPPQSSAKPVKLENWELIINTTGPIWRVYHAEYKPNPKW